MWSTCGMNGSKSVQDFDYLSHLKYGEMIDVYIYDCAEKTYRFITMTS